MIWRLLICFSLFAASGNPAQIFGRISLRGGAKDISGSGTVVWLEPLDTKVGGKPGKFSMLQKNKSFSPHVLAIPVGSSVDFPNIDPIFHNAFSNYNGQTFDIGLYPPGSSRSVVFDRVGVVRIFCNIHASMSAVIVVLDTPNFALAAADGAFQIDGIPDSRYRLHLYSEHTTDQVLKNAERVIEVKGAAQDIGTVTLDSSSFLNLPHFNKYGKPYPPAPSAATYAGGNQ